MTIVTGPWIEVMFWRVKFLIKACSKVVLPTLAGPTTATTIGGGSNGVRSTKGMCCFFVSKSWALKETKCFYSFNSN